jgi:carbamoyl-phosphate synthase large subunit
MPMMRRWVVDDINSVVPLRQIFNDHIWQELIGLPDEEYTCGVYRSVQGEIRTIVFRRRLSAGTTSYGVVVENTHIDQVCISIADALKLDGSVNVQLRLMQRGPVVFEINPRFSSTTVFRHKLGFRDVEWSLKEKILKRKTKYKKLNILGTRVYKILNEKIIANNLIQ